jgi:hypothetical protein
MTQALLQVYMHSIHNLFHTGPMRQSPLSFRGSGMMEGTLLSASHFLLMEARLAKKIKIYFYIETVNFMQGQLQRSLPLQSTFHLVFRIFSTFLCNREN